MSATQPNHVSVILDADGKLCCTPDPVVATGRNVHLTFSLQAAGYTFPREEAIVVQQPGTQFPEPSITKHADTAVLRDKNTQAGYFKYNVNLVRSSDGQRVVIDPGISNPPRD